MVRAARLAVVERESSSVSSPYRRTRGDTRKSPQCVTPTMKNSKGFSLLELMVVCAIIVILCCLALPNPAAVSAYFNMTAAMRSMRTERDVQAALMICAANHDTSTGCLAIANVQPVQGIVSGYTYTYNASPFTYTAVPQDGISRAFYTDATGLLHCDASVATAASPICQ